MLHDRAGAVLDALSARLASAFGSATEEKDGPGEAPINPEWLFAGISPSKARCSLSDSPSFMSSKRDLIIQPCRTA